MPGTLRGRERRAWRPRSAASRRRGALKRDKWLVGILSLGDLVHRRIQRIQFGEDLRWCLGPAEGLGLGVVLGDVSVDRGLQVDDRVEAAALQTAAGERREKVSTAFSQEPEVGVKWNTKRGWRASQRSTLGCLWLP
jgi:hypothetical protein